MRYLARRLAAALMLLVAISIATFALSEAAPGDFLSQVRLDPRFSEETVAALAERYGLDQSAVERYLAWLGSVAAGELGFSLAYQMPVSRLVLPRARNTLVLTVTASAAAWALALAAGTWMAWREGAWVDRLGLAASAALLAMPQLVLGLVCLFWAATSGLFPTGGMTSVGSAELGFAGRTRDLLWHLALPGTALVLASWPVYVRHVRSALLEALEAPFLRVARGHGIPPSRLVARYALPAAANPLVSLFGLSVSSLLSGALVIEIVFGWPGMGPLAVEAILRRDLHVIVGTTLVSAVFVVLGQLVADLVLYAADPRIREPA